MNDKTHATLVILSTHKQFSSVYNVNLPFGAPLGPVYTGEHTESLVSCQEQSLLTRSHRDRSTCTDTCCLQTAQYWTTKHSDTM